MCQLFIQINYINQLYFWNSLYDYESIIFITYVFMSQLYSSVHPPTHSRALLCYKHLLKKSLFLWTNINYPQNNIYMCREAMIQFYNNFSAPCVTAATPWSEGATRTRYTPNWRCWTRTRSNKSFKSLACESAEYDHLA